MELNNNNNILLLLILVVVVVCVPLVLCEGKIQMNVSNSTGPVDCTVETCLTDVVIQFFKGTKLLDSTTNPAEKGWVGHLSEDQMEAGDYVCQAMSEADNVVKRQLFHRL